MTNDIKDDIRILRMNAKELDDAIAGCSVPKVVKLKVELKESLSYLYEYVELLFQTYGIGLIDDTLASS